MRGGYYDYYYGIVALGSMYGEYWLWTMKNSHIAYQLFFTSLDDLKSQNPSGVGYGYTLRCLHARLLSSF